MLNVWNTAQKKRGAKIINRGEMKRGKFLRLEKRGRAFDIKSGNFHAKKKGQRPY